MPHSGAPDAHSGVWGETRKTSLRKNNQSQVERAQGKDMILIGFFLTSLLMLVGRSVYKIGNRIITRGSRVSNLIISFRECSNLCIIRIIFLGFYLLFYPCEKLELVAILMTSSSSSKILYENLLCF
jgi:hypothetical protein